MAVDLAAFRTEYKAAHGKKCMTCSLPPELLAEIRKGRKSGDSLPLLSSYLKFMKHPIPVTTLANHFNNHERDER